MPPDTAGQRRQDLTEKLLAAFEGSIPHVWKSPFYLLGLLIVATVILLLPLVYLGFIALTGYGIYYHIIHNIDVLSPPSVMHRRTVFVFMGLRLAAYFGPILIGMILLLFMVKPLFARPARSERRLSFVRENEPVLFAFVEKLCEVVRAPVPRRIDVDCDINAAAFFRRGFLSFLGRDLVLQIGAPLVAGLSLREFAGVLAHEFGHFSQGTGMRLTYIIGCVNGWFARVVYQRDAWDDQLAALSQEQGWFRLFFLVARLFVWLTRWILWLLMIVAHAVSCSLLRQMEYDADRYWARVCGSECSESSLKRLHVLAKGSQTAFAFIAHCWQERRLPENLPSLIVAEAERLSPEARQQIEKGISESRTHMLATHPSYRARIQRMRSENEPGILHLAETASVLFADFDALCREVTFAYYQGFIGPVVRREHLLPMTDVVRKRKVLDETIEAARRFWTTLEFVTRPFRINRFSPVFDLPPRECLERLKRVRFALERSQQTIRKEYDRLRELDQTISNARQAECLLKAGFRVDPKEIGLKKADPLQAHEVGRQAERDRQAVEERLLKIEAVFAMRIEAALALLKCDQVAARLTNAAALRAWSEELLDVTAGLHRVEYLLTSLRLNQNSLRAMEDAIAHGHEDGALIAQTLRLLEAQNRALKELREATKEVPYPYEHAAGPLSIPQYAIGIVPAANDLTGTSAAVVSCLDCLFPLYLRVMGDLARIAEQVESAVGLQPLAIAKDAPARGRAGGKGGDGPSG